MTKERPETIKGDQRNTTERDQMQTTIDIMRPQREIKETKETTRDKERPKETTKEIKRNKEISKETTRETKRNHSGDQTTKEKPKETKKLETKRNHKRETKRNHKRENKGNHKDQTKPQKRDQKKPQETPQKQKAKGKPHQRRVTPIVDLALRPIDRNPLAEKLSSYDAVVVSPAGAEGHHVEVDVWPVAGYQVLLPPLAEACSFVLKPQKVVLGGTWRRHWATVVLWCGRWVLLLSLFFVCFCFCCDYGWSLFSLR